MIANYHTHTWRCMHAVGTEREYVEAAIKGGLKILGFSDHTPMPYDAGYVSNVKMLPEQLEDYVNTVLGLKEEYKKDIEIHLGLEVEYYPAYFENMRKLIEPYPVEYFLLGQHFLGNEINDLYSGAPTSDAEVLKRYCRQSQEALRTGCFTYFAHPDLINFKGDKAVYQKEVRTLCETAKELDIPLEINFLGIGDHRNYPNPAFWEVAAEVGNKVIFGSDAHAPDKVWNPPVLRTAEKIVEEYGLERLETVSFRNPMI